MSKHPIRKEDGLYVTVKLHLKFHLHSSPKETQLFWSCLSFEEECMSVNFEPNVISIMLPVTICQKPHSKIPHHSRTVRGHLSTSHCWNFTKLVASSKLERCLSFWEECMSENLGLHNITTNAPGNNMQKTPFKNSAWLSHNLKMFEYMSSRKNHQIDKFQQLTKTWSQKFGHHFRTNLIFLSGVFCPLLSGLLYQWKMIPSSTHIHSSQKEMQHSKKLRN